MVKILVVGDIHFKVSNLLESKDFITALKKTALASKPNAIILLGDILDTHNVAQEQPFNFVYQLIESLSSVCHVYIIIGNHDLANNTQFLTDRHFFNPYKKWNDVTIVDKPIIVSMENVKLTLCPYVFPGRFREALDTLAEEWENPQIDELEWKKSDCIFCHQEFRGCNYGFKKSEVGDEWDSELPLVISGHIHDAQNLGNVRYIGSAMNSFNESPKRVWLVNISENEIEKTTKIQKIDLGLKMKKIIRLTLQDLYDKKFDISQTEKTIFKIKLDVDTMKEYQQFKKTNTFNELKKCGVKFDPIVKPIKPKDMILLGNHQLNYIDTLKQIVENSDENIKNAYSEIADLVN